MDEIFVVISLPTEFESNGAGSAPRKIRIYKKRNYIISCRTGIKLIFNYYQISRVKSKWRGRI